MPKGIGPGERLSRQQREKIELEVVSSEARLRLTRLLRKATEARDPPVHLMRQNAVINIANAVLNRPMYILQTDGWGDYEASDYGWHRGELELILRRPDTAQLTEILADLIAEGWLDDSDVNAVLESDGCGVRFDERGEHRVDIDLVDPVEVPDEGAPHDHVNIRRLFERMDRAAQDEDWSLVLHSSASIFETLAKTVIPSPNVQDKSLGSFFDLFRKHAQLAAPMLDLIQAIFNRRNVEPLSGHGSTKSPEVTREEALQVAHLTRAFVRLQRELASDGSRP
jgi:hypothetical protein